MRYTIISGTGRAGTTLLMRILTRVGLDTGYSLDSPINQVARAGLEKRLSQRPPHRIVKSPWIAVEIEEQLADGVEIEHAIICMRSLAAAAESRRKVQATRPTAIELPGGLWLTADPGQQEAILSDIFYTLVFHLTRHDIPITFLHFPRYAMDPDYTVRKLMPVFPNVEDKSWRAALKDLVKPEWISVRDDGSPAAD